jgi:hypothetical protein
VTEVPHSSEVSNVVTESHVGGTTTIPTRAGRSQSLASQAPPGLPHTLLTIRRPPPDPGLHLGRTPRALGPAGSIDDASISVASWELSRSGGATIVEVGVWGVGCPLWCSVSRHPGWDGCMREERVDCVATCAGVVCRVAPVMRAVLLRLHAE